jgi:hypothetical protein
MLTIQLRIMNPIKITQILIISFLQNFNFITYCKTFAKLSMTVLIGHFVRNNGARAKQLNRVGAKPANIPNPSTLLAACTLYLASSTLQLR